MSINVFVAGHRGMVGSAIVRQLETSEEYNIITCSREQLNLLSQAEVEEYFQLNKIDQVYLAAAKVGGIIGNNTYPADFIYENLMIQNNIIHSAHLTGVQKLLFLGSSCIYPKLAEQPMPECALLTGTLEPTNEPYAIAKIAGIKMCESYNRQYGRDYRSIMPTNLYGQNDNFHDTNSHVIPSLIRRFHEAKINNKKSVTVWGTGEARREFLHVDDMASASIYLMNLNFENIAEVTDEMNSHINIGTGVDVSISELANLIKDIVGYEGELIFDKSIPDGAPRKLLLTNKVKQLGWEHTKSLKNGLVDTYNWFKENDNEYRK